MKYTIQHSLLAHAVATINPAHKTNSKTGKFTAIKAKDSVLSVIVSHDGFAAKCCIDAKKVPDGTLKIEKEGFVVVDGAANFVFVTKNQTPDPITATYDEQKVAKEAKAKADEAEESEEEKEEGFDLKGTHSYGFQGAKGKKWNADLVVLDCPECDASFEDLTESVIVRGSDFIKCMKFVSKYAGKASMSTDWSNILIKTDDAKLVMAGLNGQQIGEARITPEKINSEMEVIISVEQADRVAKMINPEYSVSISVKSGTKDSPLKTVYFSQETKYGGQTVGKMILKVPCSTDKFKKYDKQTKVLSFKSSCVVKTQTLRNMCSLLSGIVKVRTRTRFSVGDESITFSKSGIEAKIKGDFVLPVSNATGDDLEMDLSSNHLADISEQCEGEDIILKFSSKDGFIQATIDENRTVYFIPFKDLEA